MLIVIWVLSGAYVVFVIVVCGCNCVNGYVQSLRPKVVEEKEPEKGQRDVRLVSLADNIILKF